MNKIISEIDELIAEIKTKDNSKSFNQIALAEFEFIFFITMDIVRYEILIDTKISDLTGGAISWLFPFHCFEFYHSDYPEIYKKTNDLFSNLCRFNDQLINHNLNSKVNGESSAWLEYFKESLQQILH